MARKLTDKVIVAFSGGKDSVVTLDLCLRHIPKVYVYFMYWVPQLAFQESFLRFYERQFNIDILRIPHPFATSVMANGAISPPRDIETYSWNDVHAFVRKHFDAWWIAAGERIDDSLWRRGMIKHGGVIQFKRGRIFPVAHFTNPAVWSYIKQHRLKVSPEYHVAGRSLSGLDADGIWLMRQHFPNDYAKLIEMYPFAVASAERYQRELINGKDARSKIRNRDRAALQAEGAS